MRTSVFFALFFALHALGMFAACASDLLAYLRSYQEWERQIVTSLPGHPRLQIHAMTAIASALGATLVAPTAFGFRLRFTTWRVGLVAAMSAAVAGVFLGQTVRLLLYVRVSPVADLAMVGALAGVVGGICSIGVLAVVMPSSRSYS